MEIQRQNKRKKVENFEPNWSVFGFSFGGLVATDFTLRNGGRFKNVFLFSPWFMTHKRLINNFTKIYLFLFQKFFNYEKLMNLKLQKQILDMDIDSYINLNKNLTDNRRFLEIRKKDTRIFRVLSKKRLAEIYNAQKRIFKTENVNNINFFVFLPEKDLIVDSEITIYLIRKWNGYFEILKNAYHDFLDYEDSRWDNFKNLLNICLTKIVK